MSASCPHCSRPLQSLNVTGMQAKTSSGESWDAAAFACPHCQKILGASFDGVRHTTYLLAEIKKLLGK